MPAAVDLRPLLGPVRNQGPFRGTCLAFAVTAMHELAAGMTADGLSVETLYWSAKQHDGFAAAGTTFEAASAGLTTHGQPHEHLWAYDPLRDDLSPTYQPPPAAIDAGNCRFAKLSPVDPTPAAVRTALDEDRPVAIGIRTWPALRRLNGAHLETPSANQLDGGRHAVVVVGYDTSTAEILLRNSWGASWGEMRVTHGSRRAFSRTTSPRHGRSRLRRDCSPDTSAGGPRALARTSVGWTQ
jgi:hypothetical protein